MVTSKIIKKTVISLFTAQLLFTMPQLSASLAIENKTIEEAPLNIFIKTMEKNINFNFLYIDGNFYADTEKLFKLFKIETVNAKSKNKLMGFYPFTENKYWINYKTGMYKIRGRTGKFKNDDFFTKENKTYIKLKTLNDVFNLRMLVNFSKLTIKFINDKELPIVQNYIHEAKLNKKQKNKKDIKYEKIIENDKSYFEFGKIGFTGSYLYSKNISEKTNGENSTKQSLYGGFELLKGDFYFNLVGNNQNVIDYNSSNMRIEYITPNKKQYKKIVVGDISDNSLFGKKFKGASISNNYNSFEGEFNKVYLRKYTFPNSYIEIYRNDVNYKNIKSDSKGFYSIDIPIYYGKNNIKIKIFGPHSETDQYTFSYDIRNNLLKRNQLLYDVSAGNTGDIGADVTNSNYLIGNIRYGINNNFTAKAGLMATDETGNVAFSNGTKNENKSSFYTGLYTNFKGNYNASTLYRYNDSLNTNLNYTGFDSYHTLSYNHYFNEQRRNTLSFSDNYLIKNDNLRFKYMYNLESADGTSDGSQDLGFKYQTRLFNRLYSSIGFNYTKYNKNYTQDDLKFDYRLQNTIYKRWLWSPLNRINTTVWGEYSFVHGLQTNAFNLRMEKQYDGQTKYSILYKYNANSNDEYKVQIKQDFNKYSIFSNLAYIANASYSIELGASVNLSYDSSLGFYYLDSWNDIGKPSVVVIPYNDKNNNKKYDGGDGSLDMAKVKINQGNYRLKRKNNLLYSSTLLNYRLNGVNGEEFTDGNNLFIPKSENIGFNPRPNIFTNVYYPYSKTYGLEITVVSKTGRPVPGINILLINKNTKKIISSISDLDGEAYFDKVINDDYFLEIDREQLGDLHMKTEKIRYNIKNTDLSKSDLYKFIITKEKN